MLNISQGNKTAQLSTVAFLVACAVFSGVTPTLKTLRRRLSTVPAKALAWSSYSRWTVESLFSAYISDLTTAWHYPPKFYKHPRSESPILQLIVFDYDAHSRQLDTAILFLLGFVFRAGAVLALVGTNRDQMGASQRVGTCCARRASASEDYGLPPSIRTTSLLRSAAAAMRSRVLHVSPKISRHLGQYTPIGTECSAATQCGELSGDVELLPSQVVIGPAAM